MSLNVCSFEAQRAKSTYEVLFFGSRPQIKTVNRGFVIRTSFIFWVHKRIFKKDVAQKYHIAFHLRTELSPKVIGHFTPATSPPGGVKFMVAKLSGGGSVRGETREVKYPYTAN